MRKMKIVLLLVALFAFSSELFAENSDNNKSKITDGTKESTLELKKNLWNEFNTLAKEQQGIQMEEHLELWTNEETDDWDDDWEEPDFEALKLVTAEQKTVTEEQKKLWKILFANNKK